jgi:exosortase
MVYFIIILIGIIAAFYYDTIRWLIESWLHNPYYSHGFIVPIISAYIIWNMRKELSNIERKQRKQSQIGLVLFIIGIILYGIAFMSTIRFLSGISLIITIYGTVLYIYGRELTKRMSFPILFLLLAIPVPFVYTITPPVQELSSISSSSLANLAGIPVQRDGLILHMPTGLFEVAVECSGMNSIISLLMISIIFAFILEGSLMMKFVIVLSSIPLAIIGNVLRITSILAVSNMYGQEVAINYFHNFSNILLFIISLIGLFIIGRSFGRLKFKNTF